LAIGEKSNAALYDQEHLIFVEMAVGRRSATGRRSAQHNNHRAVGLLTAQLYLSGIALGENFRATLRRDDQGQRRRGGSSNIGRIGRSLHDR
jgi:hypothetical protein